MEVVKVMLVVVVEVGMLLGETRLCLVRKVATAHCDITAGQMALMALIKLRLTVDWLSNTLLLLLLLFFIIIVISHIVTSIQAVSISIQDTVPFEPPDGKDEFLAPGEGSVVMSSPAVTLEDLLT